MTEQRTLWTDLTELRVRAHQLTAEDVAGLAAVQVHAKTGEWLLRLPDGDFRLCSRKVFQRDFGRRQ